MNLLECPIRHYDWGSHEAIARIQGRPVPTERPEAELWMGAHPDSPSRLAPAGTPLTEVIAADPAGVLGAHALDRFGGRLPYLLKVLAAARPLSLQAHPNAVHALAGYTAEEVAGKPRDAPDRNYPDPFHKPELLVAVGDFHALCGFRDPERSAALLATLDVPALKPTVDALRRPDPERALEAAVTGLMRLPESHLGPLVEAVAGAAAVARPRGDADDEPAYQLAIDLAQRYPGDVGVVVALLLNLVRLAPGEAVWMPAGNMHAYLSGTGIEIMANSDNVLRGGLTSKHVDVPELLKVLRFEVLGDPVLRPRSIGPGMVTWPTPAEEFALVHAEFDPAGPVTLPGAGPRIVFCLNGDVDADAGDGAPPVHLRGGQAAFARAGRPITVRGSGVVYQAAPR